MSETADVPVNTERSEELEEALERARERGREKVASFQSLSTEEQTDFIAKMIWREVSRGFTDQDWDDLSEDEGTGNIRFYSDPRIVLRAKERYLKVARMIGHFYKTT